jgi:ribosomal-protein-serine acetyltransferase
MKVSPDFSLHADENLLLKLLAEEDAANLFALIDANRKYLRKFLGWLDHNTSVTDSLSFIHEERQKLDRLEGITLAIYFSKTLVGLISLYNIDCLDQHASIGYWIAEQYQGEGIMTKSAQALIQYAFKELKLHRIEIRCAVHNHTSQKIPAKLGFVKEGTLKEAIAHYGKYFDAYLYGLTRSAD